MVHQMERVAVSILNISIVGDIDAFYLATIEIKGAYEINFIGSRHHPELL